eukprot:7317169-Prymnesium_polylepis.1
MPCGLVWDHAIHPHADGAWCMVDALESYICTRATRAVDPAERAPRRLRATHRPTTPSTAQRNSHLQSSAIWLLACHLVWSSCRADPEPLILMVTNVWGRARALPSLGGLQRT